LARTDAGQTFTGANIFGNVTIGAGAAITSSGAGGALGSNAFNSTAFAPLASPTFSGTVTGPDSGTWGSGGINGSIIGGTTPAAITGTLIAGKALTLSGVAANTQMLSATGGSHTGSDATTDWNFATTWNTSGSPTAFQISVTETAQGASANLLNILGGASGATSYFNVDQFGDVLSKGGITSGVNIGFTGNGGVLKFGGSGDLILSRHAAANLQLGNADAASPVAQTLNAQNVVAGTSNTAGANWTIAGSKGTGSGIGGNIVVQTAPPGAAATVQNTPVTALTVNQTGGVEVGTATDRGANTLAAGNYYVGALANSEGHDIAIGANGQLGDSGVVPTSADAKIFCSQLPVPCSHAYSIFLVSGTTWTSPPTITAYSNVKITACGGGGPGGAGATAQIGSGGGSGAVLILEGTAAALGLQPNTAITYAIGAASNSTTITINGVTYTAPGGSAGGTVSTVALGAALGGFGGTVPTNGTINILGNTGQSAIVLVAGGAFLTGTGASSPFGAGGPGVITAVAGNGGTGNCSGGGGAGNGGTNAGGIGTPGAILIEIT
jgi:hypothetical protein